MSTENIIEILEGALRLVQVHAKYYYDESSRLGALYSNIQDDCIKLRAENRELKEALERIGKSGINAGGIVKNYYETWKAKKAAKRRLIQYNEVFNNRYNPPGGSVPDWEIDCRDLSLTKENRWKDQERCFEDVPEKPRYEALCKYHKGYVPLKENYYMASGRHAAAKRMIIAAGKKLEVINKNK